MESPQTPVARVVLLGASNVTLGFRTAVRTVLARLGAPLEVCAAIGHGRSYGATSNVFGRGLPAISTCALWSAIADRPALPTFAIVTDVGNDIPYGFRPDDIEEWVDACLAQLAGHRAQVVLTGLPLEALRRLPAWKFRLFGRLFFPHRRVVRGEMLERADDVHARLQRLARQRRVAWFVPRPEWYGHDPIHVRRSARGEAWSHYASGWSPTPSAESASALGTPWRQRGRLLALDRTLFGVPAGRAQPCASLADGTQIFLY